MRRALTVLALLLATIAILPAAAHLPGEGADIAIAGAGPEPGKFNGILDIAFSADGRLHVLELTTTKDGKGHDYIGGGRVQIFDRAGKLLGTFPVVDAALGDKDTPSHLAVDAKGAVYVSKPQADLVQRYVDGKPERAFAVPAACVLAAGKVGGREVVAVVGSLHAIVNGKWAWLGGEKLHLIDPAGGETKEVPLARRLFAAKDLVIAASGDLLLLANDSEPEHDRAGLVLAFGADGALKRTLGLGGKTRVEDGSELVHSITVDRSGQVYGMTWGNPGRVVRFAADGNDLSTRPGQFEWAHPWSMHSSYVALATDPDDRLWLASATHRSEAERANHPAILRVRTNFFDEDGREVQHRSAKLLGFKPEIRTDLPYDVAYEPGEIAARVVFPAGRRTLRATDATWRVLDGDKREIATGKLSLTLADGVEAVAPISFRVPRFGWYLVECSFTTEGKPLDAIAKAIGVTSKFPGLPVLAAGDAVGGWEDTTRSVFCGLPNVRIHPHKYKGKLDEMVKLAERGKRDGATILVQFFEGKNQIDLELAKEVVTKLKGLVTYYELVNEPNFTMSPEELAALAKQLTPMAKAIDPTIKIMGPTVCGIDIGWHQRFFAAGGGPFVDIIAVHDYEGHESVSPEHWRFKFAELRKLMAANGHADTPIWQTERAISVIRGGLLTAMTQAARLTLQSDLLETLGVPREHNNHYYLNEGGFDSVPSYVWSVTGPFPAALASRTRQAMVGGRRYDGQLDFGPSGNALFMGLRHVATDAAGGGSTITLRNYGSVEKPVEFTLSGADAEVVDSWGNVRREAAKAGKLRLPLGQMPCYVRLAKGQTLVPTIIDYGRNIAATAAITFAGDFTGDLAWLTNGVLETWHGGNPLGGTGGERIWTGAPPTPTAPRVLELRWPSPRAIHRVVVQGVEADNQFCALIDYDVQVESAPGKWTTVDEVRVPLPATDVVRTAKTQANTWYVRSNRFAHEFAPIEASAVRLLVRRTTFGFAPDEAAAQTVRKAWNGCPPAATMLREVEIYAAPSPTTLTVAASGAIPGRPGLPTTVTVSATGAAAASEVTLSMPVGWTTVRTALTAGPPAIFTLTPPAEVLAGSLTIDAVLTAGGKRVVTEAVNVRVASPVELRVEPVGAIDRANQQLSATVINKTDHPISGVARLRLAGATQTAIEQPFGPLAPGARQGVTWKIASLDLGASAVTAHATTVVEGVMTSASRALTVREWLVLGPFTGDDRDAALIAGIEQGRIDVTGSYADAMGNQRTWIAARTPGDKPEQLDLAATVKAQAGAAAYAVIWIRSPTAREARLALQGKDCSVRAWLDATAVASTGADGASPVKLKAGWNRLLLSTGRTGNEWKLTTILRDAAGDPLNDVVYAAKPGN